MHFVAGRMTERAAAFRDKSLLEAELESKRNPAPPMLLELC